MPSVQFHLFRLMMRVLRRVQAKFPAHEFDADVRFRQRADRVAGLAMRIPRGVAVLPDTVDGVSGDCLIPPGAAEDPAILFLHGGGTFYGWGNPHRRMVGYLAQFAGLRAFGVDYRLMPAESPVIEAAITRSTRPKSFKGQMNKSTGGGREAQNANK